MSTQRKQLGISVQVISHLAVGVVGRVWVYRCDKIYFQSLHAFWPLSNIASAGEHACLNYYVPGLLLLRQKSQFASWKSRENHHFTALAVLRQFDIVCDNSRYPVLVKLLSLLQSGTLQNGWIHYSCIF
jgi:hypothetical protein